MATNNAINTNMPIGVGNGGTGATTLTDHGVLVGSGTAAIDALAVGATNTVLVGNTGADPSFSATPTVTSISFGGSALSTFTDWTSWTPTVFGSTTAGTTTYGTQFGIYMRIGNLVIAQFTVTYSAATGTGNLLIDGLPFNIRNTSGYLPECSVTLSSAGTAWPAGVTSIKLEGTINTPNMYIVGSGSSVVASVIQLANTSANIRGTFIYRPV